MELDPQWLSRIFTLIPVALILLAGVSALWIYFFVLSLLPESRAVINMPALSEDVRVVRDKRGAPGIIGENEDDLAHGLGYVMAEDRLWQMDFLRKAATGRLSEIFGEDYLDRDHFTRSVLNTSKETLEGELGSEEQRRWVSMFVKGVNRYISSHYSKLPVEFSLLEYKPAPFTELDVVAITRALAWSASPASKIDPVMLRIIHKLGKEEASKILPSDPALSAPLIMDLYKYWKPSGYLFEKFGHDDPLTSYSGLCGGTAWAVAGEKSRNGRTILSWNIQQALSAPRFWYRARLASDDFTLAGAFIPGTPIAISGANSKVSWGAITAPIDDADLFWEHIESGENSKVWRIDGWRSIRERTENYKPKGGSAVTRSIHYTSTGPLVSALNDNMALSLKWTGAQGVELLKAFYGINRARDSKELILWAKELRAPCMHIVWADSAHNFGTGICGVAPLRAPHCDGVSPAPAWTGAHDWLGGIGLLELPGKTNPRKGALAVAQGRPGGSDYPVFLGCYWDVADLAPRIEQMLSEAPDHSEKTFQAIQMDNFSPTAQALKPIILKLVTQTGDLTPDERKATEILDAWDCKMKGDSAAAALYGLVYKNLVTDLFRQRLGDDLFKAFTWHSPTVRRATLSALSDPGSGWIRSGTVNALARSAFSRAVKEGLDKLGSDMSDWRWDSLHTTVLKHPLTSRSRLWELVYNVGPLRLPGSDDTINYADWSFTEPFRVRAGVTLRQTARMLTPPQVMAVSPLGSSAHFFSGHYKDQVEDWIAGNLFQDPTEISEIRRQGFDAVLLKAAQARANKSNPVMDGDLGEDQLPGSGEMAPSPGSGDFSAEAEPGARTIR
jgi:penicillin amidase